MGSLGAVDFTFSVTPRQRLPWVENQRDCVPTMCLIAPIVVIMDTNRVLLHRISVNVLVGKMLILLIVVGLASIPDGLSPNNHILRIN